MPSIRSLKPNVSREEAFELFSPGGPLSLLRQAAFGPLRSLADFYIPFQLFQIEISNRGKQEQRILGVDAVNGSLDPYQFERLPGAEEVICVHTRNSPQAVLEADQARAMAISKVQRLLFTSGFFRLRGLQISAEPIPGEICIPYWVGFRGRGTTADILVMDAVRRRMEGGKVRKLLQAWLLSPE